MVTAMASAPFYDEKGEYHNHDLNTQTTGYSCSNGHRFVIAARATCWCGWTAGETTVRVDRSEG